MHFYSFITLSFDLSDVLLVKEFCCLGEYTQFWAMSHDTFSSNRKHVFQLGCHCFVNKSC